MVVITYPCHNIYELSHISIKGSLEPIILSTWQIFPWKYSQFCTMHRAELTIFPREYLSATIISKVAMIIKEKHNIGNRSRSLPWVSNERYTETSIRGTCRITGRRGADWSASQVRLARHSGRHSWGINWYLAARRWQQNTNTKETEAAQLDVVYGLSESKTTLTAIDRY